MAKNHSLGVKSVKIAWSKNWARTKTRLFLRCNGQNLFRTVEKSWKISENVKFHNIKFPEQVALVVCDLLLNLLLKTTRTNSPIPQACRRQAENTALVHSHSDKLMRLTRVLHCQSGFFWSFRLLCWLNRLPHQNCWFGEVYELAKYTDQTRICWCSWR